jgi:arsenate reductase
MAEGWTRHLKGNLVEPHSAGVNPKGVDPRAVKAMAETGIDISKQGSKSLDQVRHIEFDYVITLCDNAQKSCPTFPARTRVIDVGFEDPPKLAANAKDEAEAMGHYRRIRDEIKTFVDGLPEALLGKESGSAANQQHSFESGIKSFLHQLPKELLNKSDDREEDR